MPNKPGKYAATLPGLPKAPEDPTKQDKINEVKATITDRQATALAREYIEAREVADDLKEDLSLIDTKIQALEQLLAASQEQGAAGWGEYGVDTNAVRLPTGHIVRVQEKPDPKVVDREAFRLWCIENGYERDMHIHPKKMDSIVKERLVAGDPEPDGCEVFRYTSVRLERP